MITLLLILAFYGIRGILSRNYKIYTPWLFKKFPFSFYNQIENITTFQNISIVLKVLKDKLNLMRILG